VIIVRTTMNAIIIKRKEALLTLLSLMEQTENARGCRSCRVFRDIEDKNTLHLIEEWETRRHLDDHMMSNRFGELLGIKSLLREPLRIRIFTVSSSEGIEAVNSLRKR